MKVFHVVDEVPSSFKYYDLDRTRVLVKESDGYYVYYQLESKPRDLVLSCFNPIIPFKTEKQALKAMKAYDKQARLRSKYLGEI